jgi:hypothetical protein
MKGEMFDESRGMTPARKKMIHDHREWADRNTDLPFNIGIFKYKFGAGKSINKFKCSKCGTIENKTTNKNTCIIICSCGGLLTKIENEY